MHLILNLPPETEAKLRQAATELGKAPKAFALEALDEKLADEVGSERTVSRQEWLRQFDEWVDSLERFHGTSSALYASSVDWGHLERS